MTHAEVKIIHYSAIAPITMTEAQAMEYSSLGRKKLRKLVELGVIRVTRPDHTDRQGRFIKGKTPLYFRESIEEYLKAHELDIPKVKSA